MKLTINKPEVNILESMLFALIKSVMQDKQDKFMPVHPDYYEMFEAEEKKNKHSKIHYFTAEKDLEEAKGVVEGISKNSNNAEFLKVKGAQQIRLDKIIAVNGKPGPAYDEYDSYANACLDCMGGMED